MTEDQKVKILFVEDLPTDVTLAEREFKKSGIAFESRRVDTKESFQEALLLFRPDLVISDFSMPVFDGMSALVLARNFDPLIPFIVLTGSMNEDTAVACMKAGASDYVIKEHMSRLVFASLEAMERKKLQENISRQADLLRQSEERYRSIFMGSSAVMLMIDAEDTVIVDANKAAMNFYGWPENELIGKKMNQINVADPLVYKEQLKMAVSGQRGRFEFRHTLANGTIVDVEVHANPITIGGKLYLFSIVHDITERVAAEAERDVASAKLFHYLSTSPTITYSMVLENGKSRWNWISENVSSILGYSVKDVLTEDWWFNNLLALDRMTALKGISALASRDSCIQEYRFMRQDRSVVWLRDEMRLYKGDGVLGEIVGTLTDISEKKNFEQEIFLKSSALDAADNAVIITDRLGTIEWMNHAFCTLSGYSMEEAKGKNPRQLVKSEKQDPSFYRAMWDTIMAAQVWRGELVNRKKSGALYTEEMTITPIVDAAGRIEHFIAIKSDITQRVASNAKLESSLREKEVLLREVHHRVNNNMQIISSLLSLSAENVLDTAVRHKLAKVTRRIRAMSFVHLQIYESDNVTQIDFSLYMNNLVNDLLQEYYPESGRPQAVFEMEEIVLTLEAAIPAGLIVSELVSNALEFAFADMPSTALLTISLHKLEGGDVEIVVRDNGRGLPAGFSQQDQSTLGMRLVEILSSQLRGKVSFKVGNGTVATLRFNNES